MHNHSLPTRLLAFAFCNGLAENGTWTSEVNGTFVPIHKKNFVPTKTGSFFKLVLPPGKVVTLYFVGESERSVMPPTFHTYLQPLSVFYGKLVDAKTGNVLFAGFLLMMLLYNLLNYIIARDRSYLYYSGYLLMVAVYTSYSSDDLMVWIGQNHGRRNIGGKYRRRWQHVLGEIAHHKQGRICRNRGQCGSRRAENARLKTAS